jgi:hypothetical protein
MRMPRCPADTAATCAKTYRLAARRQERRSLEALPPRRERNEWAIARLRRAHPAGIAALSAGFGTAGRRGRRATTDIRASAQPGAEAEEDSAAVAVVAATVVVAADTDRSGGKNHDKNEFNLP